MNEILWCDHSNETSSAVVLHSTTFIVWILSQNLWVWTKSCGVFIQTKALQQKFHLALTVLNYLTQESCFFLQFCLRELKNYYNWALNRGCWSGIKRRKKVCYRVGLCLLNEIIITTLVSTCAEAVRSSLSCIVTSPKASTVSFSQGSHNPGPPVHKLKAEWLPISWVPKQRVVIWHRYPNKAICQRDNNEKKTCLNCSWEPQFTTDTLRMHHSSESKTTLMKKYCLLV